jgi:hypothetical protein
MTAASAQRIIVLWSSPRSISTAFEKAFAQRGDTATLHEPYNDCYYFSRVRSTCKYGDHPAAWDYDADAVERRIRSETAPIVFFKDMAFMANPYISDEFLRAITNTFIIRNPLDAMYSIKQVKPDADEHDFGVLALGEMFDRVTRRLGQPAVVVDGDRLRNAPEQVLRAYCRAIDLEFDPAMLSWRQGDLRRWQPYEESSHRRWHKVLSETTGFLGSGSDRVGGNGRPRLGDCDRGIVDRAEVVYRRLLGCAIAAH